MTGTIERELDKIKAIRPKIHNIMIKHPIIIITIGLEQPLLDNSRSMRAELIRTKRELEIKVRRRHTAKKAKNNNNNLLIIKEYRVSKDKNKTRK